MPMIIGEIEASVLAARVMESDQLIVKAFGTVKNLILRLGWCDIEDWEARLLDFVDGDDGQTLKTDEKLLPLCYTQIRDAFSDRKDPFAHQ